jgi:hypothetical protein
MIRAGGEVVEALGFEGAELLDLGVAGIGDVVVGEPARVDLVSPVADELFERRRIIGRIARVREALAHLADLIRMHGGELGHVVGLIELRHQRAVGLRGSSSLLSSGVGYRQVLGSEARTRTEVAAECGETRHFCALGRRSAPGGGSEV